MCVCVHAHTSRVFFIALILYTMRFKMSIPLNDPNGVIWYVIFHEIYAWFLSFVTTILLLKRLCPACNYISMLWNVRHGSVLFQQLIRLCSRDYADFEVFCKTAYGGELLSGTDFAA